MKPTQDILDYYRQPTAMTSPGKHAASLKKLPNDVEGLVRTVQGLRIYSLLTRDFYDSNVPKERENEIQIPPAILRMYVQIIKELLSVCLQLRTNLKSLSLTEKKEYFSK